VLPQSAVISCQWDRLRKHGDRLGQTRWNHFRVIKTTVSSQVFPCHLDEMMRAADKQMRSHGQWKNFICPLYDGQVASVQPKPPDPAASNS